MLGFTLHTTQRTTPLTMPQSSLIPVSGAVSLNTIFQIFCQIRLLEKSSPLLPSLLRFL